MAVLQKMRNKFGVAISVIIALSLLYFIAPMDDLMNLFGRPENVGEIGGTGISYEDFSAEVGKFTTINEITTGSSAQTEQAHQQIRNAAWQSLLDRYMFFKNCEEAGIKVGDAEVADLIAGNHLSPIIEQNPLFAAEDGTFSVERVREINRQAETDETLKLYWNYLKQSIRTQQFYSKYGSLFALSAIESPLSLRTAVEEGNTTADIELVTIPYGYVRDTTVKVSGKEVKAYYKAHQDEYKQKASRDVEYVVFEVKPSDADVAYTEKAMNEALDEFAKTDNLKNFLLKNSDRSLSNRWYKKGELATVSSDLDKFVFSGKKGISPVVKEGDSFLSARVLASANVPDSVYVKHILLQGTGAAKKADSLAAVAAKSPARFGELVLNYSADQGSADGGQLGNIGWMTQSYMIPGFESVMTAKVGKPFVIRTQYGSHVVVVTKTTKPIAKKQVAILEKSVLASKETFNGFYNEANKFATLAGGSYEGYLKAVDSLSVYSHKQNKVLESTSTFGSVDQAREVTRWIFDAKKGKASGIITVNNNFFFVVALKEVRKDGFAELAEVSSQIQNTLYTQKRNANKAAKVAEFLAENPTLEAVAEANGTTVSTRSDISFSPMSAGVVEPALLGAVLKSEIGAVSGPVEGQNAVYVFKTTRRDAGQFYTEQDAKNYASQKAQYSSQMIMPVMQEAADVVDNRARYY
ncbi:MAG: SurA N-terminal domain-containing protein [Bacteroidales bacterium]|nr:SurA N-terminal domain-containing protein [Bacteroidales bacterium]